MFVTSYGLFWRAPEIEWEPGKGNKNTFRLLGRIGANRGTIKVADFRRQRGIYILYDNYGPCYVGLTKESGLGKRLKDHRSDHHSGKWDRFSWFGFWQFDEPGKDGVLGLCKPNDELTENTNTTIGDLEALLIQAMGPKLNSASMNFKTAELWMQIEWHETQTYIERIQAVD